MEWTRPGLAIVPALMLLFGPALASAQTDDEEWVRQCRRDNNERARYCEVRVERLPAGGTLRVNAAPNGGIEVRAWDRNEVEVHARIGASAGTESEARALAQRVRVRIARNGVEADGPETGRGESWHVSYFVYVPVRSDLELESVNGPIGVSDVHGRVDAHTVNGPVSLRNLGGEVYARTTNGPLNVTLAGARWNGVGLDAETANGPVNVRLPEGYSAQFRTGTVNGPMQTDVPLTVTMLGRRERHIDTVLGAGGPPVRVVTTNGPVSIRHR